jgi:hypothetical protein
MWTDAITAYSITGLTPTRIRNTQTNPNNNFSFWNDCGGFWVWGGLGTDVGYHGVWIVEEEAVNYNHNWHTATDTISTFDWTQYVKLTQTIVALAAHQAGIDSVAPTVDSLTSSTHPVQATWYAGANPALAWTASDSQNAVIGYSYVLDQTSDTVPDTTSEGSATTTSYSGKGDGVWYFHVRSEDAFQNWSSTSTRSVRIDATAPSTTDNHDGLTHRSFTLVLTPTDLSSGVASTEYRIDGGTWTSGTSATLVRALRHKRAGLPAGAHLVEYRSTDNAGNLETIRSCSVIL